MSEDDHRKEAEIRRQRLRDQIRDQDDIGQRAMVRNWVIELMVDHGQLRESFDELSTKTGTFMSTVDVALFKGDPDTGAPGLVPFTGRVSIWLDGGCKALRFAVWLLGSGAVAGLILLVSWLKTPTEITLPADTPPSIERAR